MADTQTFEKAAPVRHGLVRPFAIELTDRAYTALIPAAAELYLDATADPNKCSVYYPWFEKQSGTGRNLPQAAALAQRLPVVNTPESLEEQGSKVLLHELYRLSLVAQPELEGREDTFHLDADRASELRNNYQIMTKIILYRAVMNLSDQWSHRLEYLDRTPTKEELVNPARHRLRAGEYDPATVRRYDIPTRTGRWVSGVLIAANRLWHSGRDHVAGQPEGNFVAIYRTEESQPWVE